jgi:hypothetical protein
MGIDILDKMCYIRQNMLKQNSIANCFGLVAEQRLSGCKARVVRVTA